MNETAPVCAVAQGSPLVSERSRTWWEDVALGELARVLFASFPRSDQRSRGIDYIRGLLRVQGRKSIRNIAASIGGAATEQRLHHFVCDSPWDWVPVRRALAEHVTAVSPPRAWVVRPMLIPKAGKNSVGVGRRYFPELGQVLNAQEAVGVWAAGEEMSFPVNWRLCLTSSWLDDAERRRQAAIPDGLRADTSGDCASDAYLETTREWRMASRPAVLDARNLGLPTTLRRFIASDLPFLARVSTTLRLIRADAVPPSRGGTSQSAGEIITSMGHRLHPVASLNAGSGTLTRTTFTAAVRVHLPPVAQRGTGPGDALLLVGIGRNLSLWPSEIWLTNMTETCPSRLVPLSWLTHRVDRDFSQIADRRGIRDFTGRSYGGWHRHVTLASAAHAVSAMRVAPLRERAPE
jgi:hypothetical protein